MSKLFIYNFNGTIYETHEAFDDTYYTLKAEADANGEPYSRQVVKGDKITNQYYHKSGIWLNEE